MIVTRSASASSITSLSLSINEVIREFMRGYPNAEFVDIKYESDRTGTYTIVYTALIIFKTGESAVNIS